MRIIAATIAFLLATPLYAQVVEPRYFISTPTLGEIDFNKPTRLIFADSGGSMRTLFQSAGIGRIRRYLSVDPNEQIIFANYNERYTGFSNRDYLARNGFRILEEAATYWGSEAVTKVAGQFTKIKSLEVFSHANTSYALFYATSFGIPELKTRFTHDAFAVFYGCNAGWRLARSLSEIWGIPVAGAHTSADFEKMHTWNRYFRYEESLKPNTGDWATQNNLAFNLPMSCSVGGCIRMKADDFPYSGMHGYYARGLPYYKFYCIGTTSDEQCLHARAKWTLGVLSTLPLKTTSTKEQYRKVVIDAICPDRWNKTVRADCDRNLRAFENTTTEQNYTPFMGPMLDCDMRDCNQAADAKSTKTFVREFKTFMKAFPYLAGTLPPPPPPVEEPPVDPVDPPVNP